MENPATIPYSRDTFNEFTLALRKEIDEGKTPLVTLRDGRIVPVHWFTKDGPEYEGFRCDSGGLYLIWENDGHSLHNEDLDMMTFTPSTSA